jgi:predicted glycosyltransferase
MAARAAALGAAAGALRPDVLVVEHYPFSKWALGEEIGALVEAVRAARPAAKVVCSVRDIPRQTAHEDCAAGEWQAAVLAALEARFDALVVHGEESLTPLAASFPAADAIRLPVAHTGIVAASAPSPQPPPGVAGARWAVASVGGGDDPAGLLGSAARAWERLAARDATGGRVLVLCGGLREGAPLAPAAGDTRAVPFDARFAAWLAGADLSVSYAGYNTCAALLAARVPAVVVANPRMSDQAPRAALLARLGVARTVPADARDVVLEDALAAALAAGRPRHAVPLDGAERAARFIEGLVA